MRLARVRLSLFMLALVFAFADPAFSQPRSDRDRGQSSTLHAYRFGGTYYVSVSDMASYYGLGADTRGGLTRAEYKTSFGQLEVEADRRDILLNGVNHWISTPILAERNRLWIAELDVLKTIDPVLEPQHLSKPGAVVHTVVIDPGHGGTDHGTHGRASYEKTMTLDVAKRVERDLAGSGLRVILTRTTDETVPLEDRVEFARAKAADLYVSIHFNSGGSADGIETYCTTPAGMSSTANFNGNSSDRDIGGSDRSAETNNRFDSQNVWLAHCIQKSTLQVTGAMDRGVRRARFWVLRYASCPAILIEGGFLTNPYEEQRILRPDYRETLARAIADGILRYKKTVGSLELTR